LHGLASAVLSRLDPENALEKSKADSRAAKVSKEAQLGKAAQGPSG
jgi:hypothetical protein